MAKIELPDKPGRYMHDLHYGDPDDKGSPTHMWKMNDAGNVRGWYSIETDELVWKDPTVPAADLSGLTPLVPKVTVVSNPVDNQERKSPWPFNGYAPGNYSCKCHTCRQQFDGDKRSIRCQDCAIRDAKILMDEMARTITDKQLMIETQRTQHAEETRCLVISNKMVVQALEALQASTGTPSETGDPADSINPED